MSEQALDFHLQMADDHEQQLFERQQEQEIEMKPKGSLQVIRDTINLLDKKLRDASLCPKCGKPQDGLILKGQSIEQAGLCDCENHPRNKKEK